MELFAAQNLARELMDRHGLQGWRFAWDRARRRFGCCSHTRRTISLSAHLVRLNDEAEVRDTILHEIAHALTPGAGHGPAWRDACVRVGARPERCYRGGEQGGDVVAPRAGLKVGCVKCNWWVDRHRVTWSIQVCRKCSKQVTWEHVRSGKRYSIERVPGGFKAVEHAAV